VIVSVLWHLRKFSIFIHRTVIKGLRSLIPNESNTKLYPFSIKKENGNIYGIVFGASHIRAVDKFLALAWKENKLNGEANYDIDDDISKRQLSFSFFQEDNKLSKIDAFKERLKEKILHRELTNNIDVYLYTLNEGHIPQHAVEAVKELKSNKSIFYEGQPHINYDSYSKNVEVNFRLKK